ncbi:uncharacterized protein LOC106174920 [Lingula anatina]|uniref:Uncharacterized protein LOC106174920 n=1 Tax=Lingula anatina TaxID=7574 RepID=A0A1S3JP57_LINAN|nr:uncharacterized protein LOC106174920 [Lingula anatina]|eukprot:XP_013412150.1 uncharacterized protein LOC106174920 [Lingula anatina]
MGAITMLRSRDTIVCFTLVIASLCSQTAVSQIRHWSNSFSGHGAFLNWGSLFGIQSPVPYRPISVPTVQAPVVNTVDCLECSSETHPRCAEYACPDHENDVIVKGDKTGKCYIKKEINLNTNASIIVRGGISNLYDRVSKDVGCHHVEENAVLTTICVCSTDMCNKVGIVEFGGDMKMSQRTANLVKTKLGKIKPKKNTSDIMKLRKKIEAKRGKRPKRQTDGNVPPFLFDENLVCQYCGDLNCPTDYELPPYTVAIPDDPSFACVRKHAGNYQLCNSCTNYAECLNNVFTRRSCASGTVFDDVSKTCVQPWLATTCYLTYEDQRNMCEYYYNEDKDRNFCNKYNSFFKGICDSNIYPKTSQKCNSYTSRPGFAIWNSGTFEWFWGVVFWNG